MADFRDFIRKESCDSQEYAVREAEKSLLKRRGLFAAMQGSLAG